ncbi:hypothetical protein ACFP2T_29230 [Plantactinospora solaniradicis]|uniref:DUF304 domain-containing protein n=1 Tax=Plantactinospora solaniradicis TaxID=1723736 RepID=A0ABW1KHF5_9ACTN
MTAEPHRLRLSVGFDGARRGPVRTIALLGSLVAAALGGLGFALAGPVLAAILAGPVLLATVLMVVFVVRAAAWLDGTRLTVRGLRTRTVDLAAARSVELRHLQRREVGPVPGIDVVAKAPPISALVAQAGGVVVRLRFVSGVATELPAEQLRALADAVSAGDCPGAAEAAAWLRDAARAGGPTGD